MNYFTNLSGPRPGPGLSGQELGAGAGAINRQGGRREACAPPASDRVERRLELPDPRSHVEERVRVAGDRKPGANVSEAAGIGRKVRGPVDVVVGAGGDQIVESKSGQGARRLATRVGPRGTREDGQAAPQRVEAGGSAAVLERVEEEVRDGLAREVRIPFDRRSKHRPAGVDAVPRRFALQVCTHRLTAGEHPEHAAVDAL